jgi:hypothetical protein
MFKEKPLSGVYLMNAIYGLAGSFVGIFIPIYLLEKNLDPYRATLKYPEKSVAREADFW